MIHKCIDTSAPEPDKMSWHHWKLIIKNNDCLSNIINIANACINLGHWPKYFKISTTVVIPKPNKPLYNNPKAFHVKIVDGGLCFYFLFSLYFIFIFLFLFFSIFRTNSG